MKLLFLYASYEGQTEKIMTRIQAILSPYFQCDSIKFMSDMQIELSKYQAIIIGSSIRYGFYHKKIKQFILTHYSTLNTMYSAFLGINMVARKPHKSTPETNSYTRNFLAKLPWKPNMKVVFAGALYYPRYNWFDKQMIRFIMWLGKGDTDIRKPIIEYTNWDKVATFAEQFKKNFLITLKSSSNN